MRTTYTVKGWHVDKEVVGGIPPDGFKTEAELTIEYDGSEIRSLNWSDEQTEDCSIKNLPVVPDPVEIEVTFGNKCIPRCSVQLSFGLKGRIKGTFIYHSPDSNDGNTGTFIAEGNN